MDVFNFVKNELDILATISEYTNLKKTGSLYWKGLCPFHHEKTPSFTVSPHKKIFYCFGCHETGDVINFIEKTESLTAFEAVQHLIHKYDLSVPESLDSAQSIKQEKTSFQLCNLVAKWCSEKLSKSQTATTYLKHRKFSKEILQRFEVGFFPAGSKTIHNLISNILHKNFTSNDLLNEHILFQGKGALYSPFEDRIIFPIKDHIGQTCGFGGRVFKADDQRPKYYNSKETTYFKKGKILFGLHIAKQEIQKQKTAFIVEGYTDCIAMHQYGYNNTVATLGTACSLDHLQQLAKHAQTVYILYDADTAGKQAILRLTQSCWQLDIELKVILLPINQDPASVLEESQSIDSYITKAVDIFTFFLQATGQQFHQHSMRDKMNAIHDLLKLIAHINDELKQNILLIKASEVLQIPLEILKKEYNNRNNEVKKGFNKAENKTSGSNSSLQLEEQILAAILHDSTIVTKQHETLLRAQLPEPILSIITKIIDCQKETKESCTQSLDKIITPQELQYAQRVLFTIESSNIKQTFHNLMVQFQKKYWKSIISHIKMKIIQAKQANNVQEVQELIDVFESVKKDLYKNGRL